MHEEDNRICILGMGYVGLTLGAAMADKGFEVCGVEINLDVLEKLKQGKAHFYEVNLETMLRRALKNNRLRFCEFIPQGEAFDVYIVTVGTPLNGDGEPRMDMVETVVQQIADHMREGSLVVLRSTMKLGTTRQVAKPILDTSGKDYDLAVCPERTIEGKALSEIISVPQIAGGISDRSTARVMNVFRRLTPTIVKVSDVLQAELVKLLDNAYRDLFFAFGNEVALMCESLGISSQEIISAANIGYERTNIALPGFVGGPCLEKDPHILIDSLRSVGFVPKLIECGRLLNEYLVDHVFNRAVEMVNNKDDVVVTIMGLAFKGCPDTDDLRGSMAIPMIENLRKSLPQATIRGQDYVVNDEDIAGLGITPVDDVEAFRDANIVVIMNNNKRYMSLDIEERSKLMSAPAVVYDCWNVFSNSVELPEGVCMHVLGS